MTVFVTFLLVGFALCGYLLVRNHFVGEFHTEIIELCFQYNERRIYENVPYDCAYDWFYHKHPYCKMVLSFKPLKLKYWYTKEEIEKLMS